MKDLTPSINIPSPHSAGDFQVLFSNRKLNQEQGNQLTKMVNVMLVDLATKKIVITMDHSPMTGFLELIRCLATYETDIELIIINSQTGLKIDSQMFEHVRCNKHEFMLENVTQSVAKHLFVFDIL